jgi:30S ribosomal protein S31
MGKGDRKSAKGKRFRKSYGVTRVHKKDKPEIEAKKKEAPKPKAAVKKATPKKAPAKKAAKSAE